MLIVDQNNQQVIRTIK